MKITLALLSLCFALVGCKGESHKKEHPAHPEQAPQQKEVPTDPKEAPTPAPAKEASETKDHS